jgi:hypothetical protein
LTCPNKISLFSYQAKKPVDSFLSHLQAERQSPWISRQLKSFDHLVLKSQTKKQGAKE